MRWVCTATAFSGRQPPPSSICPHWADHHHLELHHRHRCSRCRKLGFFMIPLPLSISETWLLETLLLRLVAHPVSLHDPGAGVHYSQPLFPVLPQSLLPLHLHFLRCLHVTIQRHRLCPHGECSHLHFSRTSSVMRWSSMLLSLAIRPHHRGPQRPLRR